MCEIIKNGDGHTKHLHVHAKCNVSKDMQEHACQKGHAKECVHWSYNISEIYNECALKILIF
jgi:hypothetical protein